MSACNDGVGWSDRPRWRLGSTPRGTGSKGCRPCRGWRWSTGSAGVQDKILRVFGWAALLRRPRIQGRAAALPYREGEENCLAPFSTPPKKHSTNPVFSAILSQNWRIYGGCQAYKLSLTCAPKWALYCYGFTSKQGIGEKRARKRQADAGVFLDGCKHSVPIRLHRGFLPPVRRLAGPRDCDGISSTGPQPVERFQH